MRKMVVAVTTVIMVIMVTSSFLVVPSPASAQNCRLNLHGTYVFPHTGIKPDGHFFSAVAVFVFHPGITARGGTLDVHAVINERGVGVFEENMYSVPYTWEDGCRLSIHRPGFVGFVTDDGRFIRLVTLDDEQMAGDATRQ